MKFSREKRHIFRKEKKAEFSWENNNQAEDKCKEQEKKEDQEEEVEEEGFKT